MKKVLIIVIGLIFIFCAACSRDSEEKGFYGTYTFEEVSYLSPLSSSTVGYVNKKMAGTKYIIEADVFKVEGPGSTIEIKSPGYIKEELSDIVNFVGDVYTAIDDDVKHQYTIYKKDGSKTYLRLYVSSDKLWIASYVDNTANGSEIIMYIYKLSK
jgi:hypothetical protein